MIDYAPFWNTLKKSEETTYTLINKYNISPNTITKLRNDKPITTTTINNLCNILHCKVEDIIRHYPDQDNSDL